MISPASVLYLVLGIVLSVRYSLCNEMQVLTFNEWEFHPVCKSNHQLHFLLYKVVACLIDSFDHLLIP